MKRFFFTAAIGQPRSAQQQNSVTNHYAQEMARQNAIRERLNVIVASGRAEEAKRVAISTRIAQIARTAAAERLAQQDLAQQALLQQALAEQVAAQVILAQQAVVQKKVIDDYQSLVSMYVSSKRSAGDASDLPSYDGIKELFLKRPVKDSMPVDVPSYDGIRELFKKKKAIVVTQESQPDVPKAGGCVIS